MKWVELRQPEDGKHLNIVPAPRGGKGYQLWHNGKYQAQADTAEELIRMYKDDPKLKSSMLADALKYEGDTMGHCVGGYCDDVAEGRSRIYSLRDAKGQPHVTVEVQPYDAGGYMQDMFDNVRNMPAELMQQLVETHGPRNDRWYAKVARDPRYQEYAQSVPKNPRIVQIKGKGNAKPKDDYIPFVQDFVKSGQWSDVGWLQAWYTLRPLLPLQQRVRL